MNFKERIGAIVSKIRYIIQLIQVKYILKALDSIIWPGMLYEISRTGDESKGYKALPG